MSRRIYQRIFPLFIVSLVTGLLIAEYFISFDPLTSLKNELSLWGVIVTTCTMIFANVALVWGNLRTLRRKASSKEIFNSVVFLGITLLFLALGLYDPGMTSGKMFLAVYVPTMGLIGTVIWINANIFFGWAAIQRMARIRTPEAAVLLLSFLFTVFYSMTILLAIWPPFNSIGEWIATVPNMAVQRGALGAAAVGGIVLGIRALVGKEPGLVEMEMK